MRDAGFTVGQPFNPYKLFNGIHIPEQICKYCSLCPGEKLVLGRFARFAGRDGKVYPSMATLGAELGLSAKQVRRYVRGLEDKSFIRPIRTAGRSSHYEILWHAAYGGERGEARRRRATTPVNGSTDTPLNGSSATPVNGTPVNGRQRESVSKRESSSRESSKESHSSGSSAKVETDSRTPAEPKTFFHSHEVDDEKPWKLEAYASPEAALRDVYRRKAGEEISLDVERRIWETIELRGVTRQQFVEQLGPHVTNTWKNPAGFLTDFARKIASKATRKALPPEPPEPPKNEYGRCAPCGGIGYLPGGGYCTCTIGRELMSVDTRMRQERESLEAFDRTVAKSKAEREAEDDPARRKMLADLMAYNPEDGLPL